MRTPRSLKACERCGTEFKVDVTRGDARFCSRTCYWPKDALLCTCARCGKEFRRRNGQMNRIYCSAACYRPETLIIKTCPQCAVSFHPTAHYGLKFCGRECWKADMDSRNAVQTRDCLQCGVQFTSRKSGGGHHKFCGHSCSMVYRLEHQDGFNATLKAKIKAGYRTDIEAMVEAVLQELGVLYQFEQKIGRYSVDFLLPTLGIALEADGWRHTLPENIDHDVRRDAYLLEKGWRVVRLPDKTIRTDTRAAVIQALGLSTHKLRKHR